jgi:hypothetical protein
MNQNMDSTWMCKDHIKSPFPGNTEQLLRLDIYFSRCKQLKLPELSENEQKALSITIGTSAAKQNYIKVRDIEYFIEHFSLGKDTLEGTSGGDRLTHANNLEQSKITEKAKPKAKIA